MKKAIAGLVLGAILTCGGIARADDLSPVEKVADTAVKGAKNMIGLGLKAVHVVFHGAESVIHVGIDLAHSGLKVLEIPFSNGQPLVEESGD